MPRNTKEIIVRDRQPELRKYRDKLIISLYVDHKYTLDEILTSLTAVKTRQGLWKIIKANRQ